MKENLRSYSFVLIDKLLSMIILTEAINARIKAAMPTGGRNKTAKPAYNKVVLDLYLLTEKRFLRI